MPKILASVQADQFSTEHIRQLEAVLRHNYLKYVGKTKPTVIWCKIPDGQCYTNYQLSRSSLVSIECENDFPQERREAMLHACAKDWVTVTGQDTHEVMLSLLEHDLFNRAVQANQQRLSTFGRIRFNWHVIRSLMSAKWRKGFLSFSPNL